MSLARTWSARLADLPRPPRVLLADGDDPRAREAADRLARAGVTALLLSETQGRSAGAVRLQEAVGGPAGHRLEQLAQERGWDHARRRAVRDDACYVAAAMVATGEVDAVVAGAARPTGDVLRAALHVIGLAPGTQLLSSCFLLEPATPEGRVLAFGDCGVVPEPDAEQLADIAISTAATFGRLTGTQPRVAMLSFSTHGSAQHQRAQQVRDAVERVRRHRPDLDVDGELQFDAALDEAVARSKAPGSAVAGRANVMVFPDLASGNIGYKIAQRLGGLRAYGPILQGLAAPMNDLSRGCNVEDVVNVALISAVQAGRAVAVPAEPARG